MIGYCTLGTNNLPQALEFYDELLGMFGARRLVELERGVIYGVDTFELGILQPFDGQPAVAGNGAMVALKAGNRAQVDAVHARALALGGRCEGAPGGRGPDPDGFYGAYFRDPQGNKLCVYGFGPV
ncbi:VOC family protein [Pseudomonas koreensis]|uniref:VOC family protein n=1 Tax=Pseudomonas koreensis TaxID=198620 RepID=A0A9X3BF03_9PSED|nr:VOC family protein [Pseudomonas koreensis]MCU7250893.1 VOC family protein [Pseudomonas koreensis]